MTIPRFRTAVRSRLAAPAIAIALCLLALLHSAPAQAEGRLRIAKQYGIVYLLLDVAKDQKLIEKHGKAAGLDIDVEFRQLSGGAAVNDALLTGSIDVAAPASGRCSRSGTAPADARTCAAWPRSATSRTT